MKLSDYLEEGYLVVRGPFESEDQRFQHRVPIRHPETGKKLMYHFNEDGEFQLASDEWKKNKTPIGFRPSVVFNIKGFYDFELQQFDSKDVVRILTEKGYSVEVRETNIFEVQLGEYSSRVDAESKISDYESELLQLSISYKLGFDIVATGKGEFYNFQTFNFGPMQTVKTKLEKSTIQEINLKQLNEEQLDFLQRLKSFYGQTSLRSKTIVGWAILDDYFHKGKTQIESSEWKTVQYHAEQIGITGYNFENLYSFRCAKAHEFQDKPEAIEAVKQIEDIFDKMKTNLFSL